MTSAGLELAIPANKRLQTYSVDRTATGIGFYSVLIRLTAGLLILKHKYLDINPWRAGGQVHMQRHFQD
jgi:hypothetical protein